MFQGEYVELSETKILFLGAVDAGAHLRRLAASLLVSELGEPMPESGECFS